MDIKPNQPSDVGSTTEPPETYSFYFDEVRSFNMEVAAPSDTEPKQPPRISMQIVVVRKPPQR